MKRVREKHGKEKSKSKEEHSLVFLRDEITEKRGKEERGF